MSLKLNKNAGRVLHAIVYGITFGGQAPLQVAMAKQLGISQTMVSEIIDTLRTEGFVEGRGKSVKLTEWSKNKLVRDPFVIRALLELHKSAKGSLSLSERNEVVRQLASRLSSAEADARWWVDQLVDMEYLFVTGSRLTLNGEKIGEQMMYLELWKL